VIFSFGVCVPFDVVPDLDDKTPRVRAPVFGWVRMPLIALNDLSVCPQRVVADQADFAVWRQEHASEIHGKRPTGQG
jgi:hypothetical protein